MRRRTREQLGLISSPRREQQSSWARWRSSRRMLPLLIAAGNLSGCCHVPGGRCRDWWRNGFKVGPELLARRPPGGLPVDRLCRSAREERGATAEPVVDGVQ